MKKFVGICVATFAILSAQKSMAQGSNIYNRWGIFGSAGVNNINGSVDAEYGTSKSLKGKMSVSPSIGLFYELAADKNLSFIVSAGLTYNSFAYSYSGKFTNVGYSYGQDSIMNGMFPDAPGEEIKRSVHSFMVTPQMELSFITDPLFKETTCLEFRLGLGAAVYMNKKDAHYGNLETVQNSTHHLTYYYAERINMGNGTAWGNTYGSLYIGMRWRNTTSDFLNRSTIGLQALLPFNSNRAGGVTITNNAFYWDQDYQKETAKFRLNTIGLKYSYSFRKSQF